MTLSTPTAIEPVKRAFLVLEMLNRNRTTTLAGLAQATDLPKPTVARMIETLIALGYATHVSRTLGYRITDRVLVLASGLRFVDHLVDAASGPMDAFTRETGWPLYLGTISAGAIMVRYSTASQSPLSFERANYDAKLSIFASALGRVYFAFCSQRERSMILREISALDGRKKFVAPQRFALERQLVEIRSRGFAATRSSRPSRLNGIAVPILRGEHVLGAVSLRYPKSAMSEAQAATRWVSKLNALADEIAEAAYSVEAKH
jgi:IclR family transcriptional regulator, mhp operon transcriptional activator